MYRMTQRIAVPEDEKTGFVGIGPARLTTPESGMLDPRVEQAPKHADAPEAVSGK
jgi:hypothetical protein